MNQVSKLKKLEKLSYFDKNTLLQVICLRDNSLYANIKRWLRTGRLIQLKRGLYVTDIFYSSMADKTSYAEFVANKLREPSYLSLEYVLQKYGMLTEAVYGYTSVTLKTKKAYKNRLGVFSYNSISPKFFTGYEVREIGQFSVYEATKAKALFDYLYLKFFRTTNITKEMFESFRLNLDSFTRQDVRELKGYCDKAGIEKYRKLVKIIGGQIDK